jgi:hypothetical protein
MKRLIVLSVVLYSIVALSHGNSNDSTIIICGKVENAANTRINLNHYSVFGSRQYYTYSDSAGNFKFLVDFNGIPKYDLFINTVYKIPVFVGIGDSIYISFNHTELNEYHDFLLKPSYTGKGSEKNQHFYFLLKDRWAYQDSVGKLRELDDPFKYRSVFLDKLESEKNEIITYFKRYPELKVLKQYALEDSKYYWLSMAMQYHHVKKNVNKKVFPLILDSLGYFDFLQEYEPYSDYSRYIEWFNFFINEYLFYLFFTKKGEFFFDMKPEDQVQYIINRTSGIIQDACLTHFEQVYGIPVNKNIKVERLDTIPVVKQ